MRRRIHPERSVRLIPQRHAGDCVVAALSSFLSLSYADVACVAREVAPGYFTDGISTRQMFAIARKLGYPLRTAATFDAGYSVGLIRINLLNMPLDHIAILNKGLVLDVGNSEAVPVGIYLSREHGRIEALYTLLRK